VPDIYYDVDTALSEVPVNVMPLTDDTDFKTRETAVAYNAAGMDLVWNFCTSGGAFTQTAVTPTTGGTYDWTHQGGGMYTIEMPASGGASINNDSEGYGWFTGFATGVLPWRSPVIGFRAAALNDALVDTGDLLTQIADTLLKRDMSAVTGESARSPLNALRFLRNKWSLSGTTLTVTKEDDSTQAWTATVTASAGADPITGSDPA
jgi:hypothetical protein